MDVKFNSKDIKLLAGEICSRSETTVLTDKLTVFQSGGFFKFHCHLLVIGVQSVSRIFSFELKQ